MTVEAGPNIVSSGLILNLDAASSKSYPGSGTTWSDLSGNGNNGTLTNSPTFNSSNQGSFVFSGTNHVVGTSISSQLTTDMTAEAWILISATVGDWVRVVGTGGNGGNRTFGLWIAPNATTLLWQRYGTVDPALQPSTGLTLGQWSYIAATTSGSSHIVYLNGISIGSATASGPWGSSGENITIAFAGFHSYLNGRISNVKLYNRGLSQAEISQNFNALRGRYGI